MIRFWIDSVVNIFEWEGFAKKVKGSSSGLRSDYWRQRMCWKVFGKCIREGLNHQQTIATDWRGVWDISFVPDRLGVTGLAIVLCPTQWGARGGLWCTGRETQNNRLHTYPSQGPLPPIPRAEQHKAQGAAHHSHLTQESPSHWGGGQYPLGAIKHKHHRGHSSQVWRTLSAR